MTTSTVAALLTIVGFSLYDTIIVFDRIRENVPRMPSAAFSQIVNRSMSEVIVRSLATSFCTILPVLALFLFGGETLKDFAFALIVGTVSGAYSSVFIAGAGARRTGRTASRSTARASAASGPSSATCRPTPSPMGSAPVDVAPAEPRGGRRSVTAPQDPTRCRGRSSTRWCATSGSRRSASPRAPAPRRGRPAGGRRARADGGRTGAGPRPGGERRPRKPGEPDGDAERPKPKKPRNRKHGRPR